MAFLPYRLQVTLKHQLRQRAPGRTPRAAIETFKTMQMVDVQIPTTDEHTLLFSRTTQPELEHRLRLDVLRWYLLAQLPPKITAPRVSPVVAVTTV